VRLKTK